MPTTPAVPRQLRRSRKRFASASGAAPCRIGAYRANELGLAPAPDGIGSRRKRPVPPEGAGSSSVGPLPKSTQAGRFRVTDEDHPADVRWPDGKPSFESSLWD